MDTHFDDPEVQKEWDSIPENMKTTIDDVLKDQIQIQLIKKYADEMQNGLKRGIKEENIRHKLNLESINKIKNEEKIQIDVNEDIFIKNFLRARKDKKNDILKDIMPEFKMRELLTDKEFKDNFKQNILKYRKFSQDFVRENMVDLTKDELAQYSDNNLDIFKRIEAKECIGDINIQLKDPNDILIFSPIFIMYFFRMQTLTENIEDRKLIKEIQNFIYNYQAVPFLENCYYNGNIITDNPKQEVTKLYKRIKQILKQIQQDFNHVIVNFQDVRKSKKYGDIYRQINLYLAYRYKDKFECLKNIDYPLFSDFLK